MGYVYWKSEPQLWTVGYYRPDGTPEPESDHGSKEEAAARVHYLNGGKEAELELTLEQRAGYHADPRD